MYHILPPGWPHTLVIQKRLVDYMPMNRIHLFWPTLSLNMISVCLQTLLLSIVPVISSPTTQIMLQKDDISTNSFGIEDITLIVSFNEQLVEENITDVNDMTCMEAWSPKLYIWMCHKINMSAGQPKYLVLDLVTMKYSAQNVSQRQFGFKRLIHRIQEECIINKSISLMASDKQGIRREYFRS